MAKNIELYHANGTSFELVYPKTDWSLIINKPSTFTPTSHTHSASNITTGTFSTARIPSLDASKITTGIFGIGRIPATDSRDGGGYGAVLYAEAMYQHLLSSDHDSRYLRPSIFSLDGTTLTITT